MKKILISIFIILICFNGFSQTLTPSTTPGFNSRSTLPVEDKIVSARQHFNLPRYSDTSQANTYGLIDSCGAMIFTYDISAVWYRACYNGRTWIQLTPSGSPSGSFDWKVGGNNMFPGSSGNQIFGITSSVNSNYGIDFRTRNTTRFILDSTGILDENSNTVPLGIDTATKRLTYSTGGGGSSSWLLAGNTGTNPLNDFIGTTDNVGLMFKTNNIQSGYIDLISTNTSFGSESLMNNTSGVGTGSVAFGTRALQSNEDGQSNTAIGANSLRDNVDGSSNVAIGGSSLQLNISGANNVGIGVGSLQQSEGSFNLGIGSSSLLLNTGNYNTAFGVNSMFNNDAGSNNISLGYYSGVYNTTQNSRLYINSLDRTNILGDTTKSIIYGAQDATAANQRLYLNSKVYAPYIPSGVGSFAVRYDTTTKEFTYADTTSGGGTPSLTATQIAFGDGSNLMTSSSSFLWDNSTKTMTLDSNTFNKNFYTMLGDPTTNIPTLIQMRRNSAAPLFTGAIGAGGSTEMNVFNNLDYRTSVHKYYDSTKNAIWTYLGYTNGWGIQYVPAGNTNNDIFNQYGKEIFSVDLTLQPSSGVAKRFQTRVNTAEINLADEGGTRYTNPVNDTRFFVNNGTAYVTGGSGVSRFFSTGNLRISPDGYNTYADATAISTFTDSANSTYSIYENKGNNTNYNRFRYIKTLASSYNIGAGQKIIETDYNGGVAYDGVRATSTVTGGFSNAEFYWKTTNTAGVNAERMTLSEDGNLGLGTVTPSKVLHTVGTVRHASLGTASTDTTTYKPVGINSSGDLIGMTTWPSGGGGGGGSGITVGTTTISSGTSGRIGYNNAGVYNEYTTTGTGTEVVKSTSPTINADITLTGAYANLNINANTATNSFVSLGVNGTIYGYYGTCGNTNAFITGSAVGDMCFRGVNDNILFSTNNGTSSQMTIKSTGVVQMSNYGAGTATFDASGNISSVSDERLKTAIKPYTSGLKQLLLLKPIQYKWNEKSGNETKETYAGFSAQNVKSAIPYGTGENKDGYLSLQERAIVATLVNAVKEQQQQIEELKREIIKLQNK